MERFHASIDCLPDSFTLNYLLQVNFNYIPRVDIVDTLPLLLSGKGRLLQQILETRDIQNVRWTITCINICNTDTCIPRFLLRRAAVRAVSAQPSRQLSTLRQSTRVTSFQTSTPSLYRSFHQSRIWRAEEDKKEREEASPALAETTNETVTEEPSKQDESIKEESIATPSGVADAAQQPLAQSSTGQPKHAHDAVSESSGTTSSPLGQSEAEPHTISEQASNIAEKAKETVNDTISAGAEAAQKSVGRSAQNTVKDATEKAQDALSGVAEAAQNTVSSAVGSASGFAREQQRQRVEPSRILYVGNLFFEVTAPQLEAEFARYGEITNSRVVTDNRGLSKGFGYIEFGNQEAADNAVKNLDQKVFQGRRMAVQYHVRRERGGLGRERALRGENTPSKTLFIGNMSYQMSDRDLNGESTIPSGPHLQAPS